MERGIELPFLLASHLVYNYAMEIIKKTYCSTISIDAFESQQVHNPLPYRDGESITRRNIAPWFVRGFAISRGDPVVQYAYVRWSAARTGLDFHTTLENFVHAGAGECLTEAEKQVVRNAYNKIRIHGEEDRREIEEGEAEKPVDPVRMLGFYASAFADESGDAKEYQAGVLEDFPSLDVLENLTKAEFIKWANERYKRTLATRAELERIRQEKS